MSGTRFCFLEQDFFPSIEFVDDPAYGWVHETGETRHTVSGESTDDEWPYEDLGGA